MLYLFVSTKAPSIDINNCDTIVCVFGCSSFLSTITITPSGNIYWLTVIAVSDVWPRANKDTFYLPQFSNLVSHHASHHGLLTQSISFFIIYGTIFVYTIC